MIRSSPEFRRLLLAHSVSRAGDASTGAVLFDPAAGSLLPDIVDHDDLVAANLVTANSAMWTAAVIGQIALAPLAGLVIAPWGVDVSFAINAATFSAALLFLAAGVGLTTRLHPVTDS